MQLLGTHDTAAATTSSPSPPASPPVLRYDGIVAEPQDQVPQPQEVSLSPEVARLPPPQTPASVKSRDTTSDYYTAVWGSPYEFSPSQTTRSARTAVSELLLSDDLDEPSPDPTLEFGLEHLIPSRLGDLSLSRPTASTIEPSRPGSDHSQTPKSRTQRWVQLPQREDTVEKIHWWSDESAHSRSDSEGKRPRVSSSTSSVRPPEYRAKRASHKSREDNRTLDQHSFLQTLRERRSGNMSTSLLDSRWAATPEPNLDQQVLATERDGFSKEGLSSSRWADIPEPTSDKSVEPAETIVEQKGGLFASRWAATPEPAEENNVHDEVVEQLGKEETTLEVPSINEDARQSTVNVSDEVKVVEPSEKAAEEAVSMVPAGPVSEPQHLESMQPDHTLSVTRLEAPRLKKRVSWRGKNILISIPRLDYKAAGLLEPMSRAEIQERMKQFEDAGYNIHGYDLSFGEAMSDGSAQVRDIFPNETESHALPTKSNVKVLLPDLQKWRAYTDWLTEQKLAALGVTLGSDEPAAPSSQDMSRQSSNQYPPLPFSPPISTGSAGSMGRPGMIRGHSHTMSMATPVSPLNGPFGHMHRHSTVTGSTGFPTLQQLQRSQQHSPAVPTISPFSPQQQFGIPGLPRGSSPAQITALRQDLGNMRGPGSPLNQHILPQSPQDYNSSLIEDQRRRQHAYSQSMYQPTMPSTFMSQGSSVRQTPMLPQLPEDDDEEELAEPEPPAYVPPHKRVQANTDIAVPTPRGHRHNISEGLERDLLEAEQHQKLSSRDWIEVTEEGEGQPAIKQDHTFGNPQEQTVPKPIEKDPLGADYPVQETTHTRKKSGSRFNVAAPSFTFNPGANFQPSANFQPLASSQPEQTSFTFGTSAPSIRGSSILNHSRHHSSGSFNAAAPAFQPASSEFSFSSNGPSFNPSASLTESSKDDGQNIVDESPSIFGKVHIPDIVKPARRSKAVAIVRPDERKPSSGDDFEDDEGRVAQGNAKRKQQRKVEDDGDQVPLFAEPAHGPMLAIPPPEKILGSNHRPMSTVDEIEAETEEALEDIAEKGEETVEAQIEKAHERHESAHHGHKHSTSLSALAKPFEPPASSSNDAQHADQSSHSISDLEEGEIRDEESPAVSPVRGSERSIADKPLQNDFAGHQGPVEYPSDERNDQIAQPEPSFDEIDAVMRQLNAEESEKEPEKAASPARLPSPGSHPMKGVTYLAEWSRSDAPSPSPRRQLPDSLFHAHNRTDSEDRALDGWSQVRQLNKADEVPTSDWSGILSPPDEEKLHQRSNFFDSHIDKVIGRIVEQRLQPLEESLRNIHTTVNRRNRSSDLKLQRSSSNVESDADDEDEMSDDRKQRPISRGRDKRVDQIKSAVLEALREQSPQRSQASIDIAELHSVLADMKVSFARAASASLELDDVRAVVEESLHRQNQAIVPVAAEEGKESHRRELSELEGRLNETLAGALEEANHRRQIEEREAEARRQLRFAEEELQLVREKARDEDSRSRTLEQERLDLIDRLGRAEQAQRDAEERLEDSEAGKDALQATLEEYRVSSKRWRQDIDDGKRVREELEQTLAEVERQNEEQQESSSSMKRRLERLHSDMATATGQLASEKAIWNSKEEDYRTKIETLESQQLTANRERAHLEDELRIVRASVLEATESRHVVEQMRATNNSLDATIRDLQGELTEQQALATRYERQFHDAQESGRAEVHRTRMSLETEVEAANHQVNLVRAELEAELVKLRTELDNMRMQADNAKARQEHLLEQEETVRREALRKVNHSNSVALDEARHKYEAAIQDLTAQQTRAISLALEDKQRTELFLNEKLALSDAKLQHYQERVSHLEERLQIAKSAAQAAALNAKASKSLSPPSSSAGVPEKVSPQALRESILVLQEQLQERESRIERLQTQLDEGPAELKERDTEINWLRELLAVRSEELTDLVNTISRPNFDRASVRDTAIRIRANLQMEQQEKERFSHGSQTLGGQALASLSSFATPKAAQLSTAFNKWRTTMESSALRTQARSGAQVRSDTPSKTQARPQPLRYPSGLMTPPASNVRSSPIPDETSSLPPPRLQSRSGSKNSASGLTQSATARPRHASGASERSDTPLFREQSYDRDADDQGIDMESFEDDDLNDVADAEPPAFRSLESELDDSAMNIEEEV